MLITESEEIKKEENHRAFPRSGGVIEHSS